MSTISDGTTTVTPILITGWDTDRAAANVFHDVIGRVDDDVTYRPAGMRAGSLVCLCESLEAALALETLVAQPKKFTLTDTDHPSINMAFVPNGRISVELDDDTRKQATVTIDFKQVAP